MSLEIPMPYKFVDQGAFLFGRGAQMFGRHMIPGPFRTSEYFYAVWSGGLESEGQHAEYDPRADVDGQELIEIYDTVRRAGATAVIGEEAITNMVSVVLDSFPDAHQVRQESIAVLLGHIADGHDIRVLSAAVDHGPIHPDSFAVATDLNGKNRYMIECAAGSLAFEGPSVGVAQDLFEYMTASNGDGETLALSPQDTAAFLQRELAKY